MEPLSRDELGSELEIIGSELELVEDILLSASEGKIAFLTESATYLTRAGGKRLRPALMLLASMMGSGSNDSVRKTAAAIEMTHLATLYHDDVIDEADLRRGVPSANEKWGNTVAILAGDYLFARASAIAAEVRGIVPAVLADAIAEVVHGQVRELEAAYDPGRSLEHYMATIREKTASLVEASALLGADLGGCPPDVQQTLARFGASFGYAFQVADDLLDLAGDRDELGKAPGTDLRDGVYTLPVIIAVGRSKSLVRMLGSSEVDIPGARAEIERTGAFAEARAVAEGHAREALTLLEGLPEGPARKSLEGISRLVVERVPLL